MTDTPDQIPGTVSSIPPADQDPKTRVAVYPCLTSSETSDLLKRLLEAKHLHTTYSKSPCIGLSYSHLSADEYKSRVSSSNHEIAAEFPLLFFKISQTYRSLGHSVVYPSGLALPLICLARPVPTPISRQFLCLASGNLQFTPPSGPCVQWHGKPDRSDIIFFA